MRITSAAAAFEQLRFDPVSLVGVRERSDELGDLARTFTRMAAEVQEKAFWYLDQPVARIAAKNTPVPTSPALEDAMIPQPAEIAQTLREVARA